MGEISKVQLDPQNAKLEQQIARQASALASKVDFEAQNQSAFLRDNDNFLFRNLSPSSPNTTLWLEAKDYLDTVSVKLSRHDLVAASAALQKAYAKEDAGRSHWSTYLEVSGAKAEAIDDLRGELAGKFVRLGSGVASAAVGVVTAATVAGVLLLSGAPVAVIFGLGLLAGGVSGVITGGVTSMAQTQFVEGIRKLLSEGTYQTDDQFIYEATNDGVTHGALNGIFGGAFAAAGVVAATGAEAGGESLEVAGAGLKTIWDAAKEGLGSKGAELLDSARRNLVSPKFWGRAVKLGGVSTAARVSYDVFDEQVMGHEKAPGEVGTHAVRAFVLGGFTGGAFPGAYAYAYPVLNIFGDVSEKYITNIRGKYGDKEGTLLAGGLMVGENALATAAIFPFVGSWSRAAGSALWITAMSVSMETYFQKQSGKDLTDLDPGRFVGMSMWGHYIATYPTVILGESVAAPTLTVAFERATEIWAKYTLFVNPVANDFSATVNHQNWNNVQEGHTLRQALTMLPSHFAQGAMGPLGVAPRIIDEAYGAFMIAQFNKPFPPYEGVPDIWMKGLLRRVEAVGDNTGFDPLTNFLSKEMGKLSLLKGGNYYPSEINLKEARVILASVETQTIRHCFTQYVEHLNKKASSRTPQEEAIFEYFKPLIEEWAIAPKPCNDYITDVSLPEPDSKVLVSSVP